MQCCGELLAGAERLVLELGLLSGIVGQDISLPCSSKGVAVQPAQSLASVFVGGWRCTPAAADTLFSAND